MLAPKRIRHRKVQRGSMKGNAKGGTKLNHGEWGIQALDRAWITNRQIEACRVAITRKMRRGGNVWITIFPDKPISKKPAETRMGKGKGAPEAWVAVVKPGRIMFEISGTDDETAREALRLGIHKLPIKCKIVHRESEDQD
ncbi:MAG: 50S ribosomal protein L16 [Coriobacteriia bacterium]|nr:50S ribosomal protein L16 [Coriobacteriia bacterium]